MKNYDKNWVKYNQDCKFKPDKIPLKYFDAE